MEIRNMEISSRRIIKAYVTAWSISLLDRQVAWYRCQLSLNQSAPVTWNRVLVDSQMQLSVQRISFLKYVKWIFVSDFTICRHDRAVGRGVGVAILVSSSIRHNQSAMLVISANAADVDLKHIKSFLWVIPLHYSPLSVLSEDKIDNTFYPNSHHHYCGRVPQRQTHYQELQAKKF